MKPVLQTENNLSATNTTQIEKGKNINKITETKEIQEEVQAQPTKRREEDLEKILFLKKLKK